MGLSNDKGAPTIEGIASKLGIGTDILYQWARHDSEFSDSLEKLKSVQREDPFGTGTVEDSRINSVTVAFLLLETWDRHYKSGNI